MDESTNHSDSVTNEKNQPSITSNDPAERKLARRLRIQRRLEEAAKVQAINDGTYVEPEAEKPALDQAIETSEDVLENLFIEGKETVSNVRVASDAREVERRELEAETRNARLKMLEEEAAVALEKLNEITNRWEIIQDLNDPLNLHEHMKEQKEKCLELIQQKNELIKSFQTELKMADEKYMKDRRKMYDDLSLLTHRIDEQVLVMKKAYRLELKNIETVIDNTRIKKMEEHQRAWQALYNQRERDEVLNVEKKFKMVENHESELDELHKDHEEKYRETRIKLETDIQTLEQELERVKALCLLNSEKLDYNYQVLKKREEENVYIKNHQKRKLNKLQDIVNTLKKKIEDKQNLTDSELKRLHQDVKRYHANVVEMEKKADHFSRLNEDTYQSIWDMKAQEAKEILDKILAIDKIIHDQILGIAWTEPELKLMQKKDLPSFKSANKVITDLFSKPGEIKHNIDLGEEALAENKRLEYEKGHRKILKQILEMIADQAGFLIEEKLDDLLKPYTTEEKTLVRLDNVFTAIGIQTERDVNLMKNAFLPYAVCPLCESGRPSDPSCALDASSERTRDGSQYTSTQTADLEDRLSKVIGNPSGTTLNESDKGNLNEDESGKKVNLEPAQLLYKEETKRKSGTFQCNITHPLMIEKIYVLYALKDFVMEFHADNCRMPVGMGIRLAKKRNTVSRMITKEDVDKYWQRFKQIFPTDHEKLWDTLFKALSRYHAILQERHKLNLRAKKMRQQNLELRRLLAQYVTNSPSESKFYLPHLSKAERNVVDMEQLQDIIKKIPM